MDRWAFFSLTSTTVRFAGALIAALLAGCASPGNRSPWVILAPEAGGNDAVAQAQRTIQELFPPHYRAVHRAIITLGHRQFACDGFLTVSANEGRHLAVVSTFGLVTELRLRNDGVCEVLKTTPLLRESWSRGYVARDLRWLFSPPVQLAFAGRLADRRLVFETPRDGAGLLGRYVCAADGSQWQEFESSREGRRVYHVVFRHYRKLAAWSSEIPTEIHVDAGVYQLDLRIAELWVPEPRNASEVREDAQP